MSTLIWVCTALGLVIGLSNSVAILALYQHFGRLYLTSDEGRANQGPAVGTSIASIGGRYALPPDNPQELVILFTSPACTVCGTLLASLHSWSSALSLVVASTGADEHAESLANARGIRVLNSQSLFDELNVHTVPFAVVVDGFGLVKASGMVNSPDAITALTRSVKLVEVTSHSGGIA